MRLSNAYGAGPLVVRAARVARAAGGGAIAPGTDRALRFGGDTLVTIPPGGEAVSDPLPFDVPALADVAVTLRFGAAPAEVTGHPGARATSWLQADAPADAPSLPDAERVERWYVLRRVEVLAGPGSAAVVTLGNSITDGRDSGTDRNGRWPDHLARRLQSDPRTRRVAVVNAGVGGNAVLAGGLGPTALERLDRDALAVPGARWLVVLHGVNDIGAARGAAADTVARRLTEAYAEIARRARAGGLRVYGATIPPFGGSFYDLPERRRARAAVNAWIRASGAFDAVIDFDAALRDPADPERLRAEADGGDHLHPGPEGYRRMGAAVDLALFR